MKHNFKKVLAATLAMTMCVPVCAFAEEGTFETSFDVYSPKLTISVPVKLDIEVNPIADSAATTKLEQFTVASNSIDIMNASVDVEKDVAIPVNVTVKAAISSKKDDVVTEYNTFTPDATSTKKRINLNLSEADTAAVLGAGKDDSGAALSPAFKDGEKVLDLSKYAVATAAVYNTTPAKSTAITQYGSLLSVNIAGPATTDNTAGATFSSDATKVTAAVGSFAVTGVANTNADWKADDIAVAVTYNVKASKALTITTPAVAAATQTSGTSAADVVITVPNVGEATVTAVALHNDNAGAYGDVVWEEDSYKVEYVAGTPATTTDAKITIKKDDSYLVFLAGDDYKTKKQDLIIALSDGRYVVTTLTVN